MGNLSTVLPVAITVAVIVLALLAMRIVRIFEHDPDRGMQLFGAVGMLVHSIFKSKREPKHHKHRRRGDAAAHEHRRHTPRDMPTIRMFAPPPRRPSAERPQSDDTPPNPTDE